MTGIPSPHGTCTSCYRRQFAAWLLGGTATACTHGAPPPLPRARRAVTR